MNSKRMYVGSAGIIALAIFIYLGFFAPNPAGEDTTGTINTVQKYQTGQMTDADVILEGEETVLDELAELVDYATIEEKAELLGNISQEMAINIMGRVDKKFIAREVWGAMEKDDQVAAFNALARDKQEEILGRVEKTLATFGAMNREKQAAALQGATIEEKTAMFERAPQKAKLAAFRRMDMQGRAFMMNGANIREKAIAMNNARPDLKNAVMERMDMQGRLEFVRTASTNGRSFMFKRADDIDKEAMLLGATDVEKDIMFGRLALQDQIDGTLNAMAMDKDFNLLGRATGDVAYQIYAAAPPRIKRALWGRLEAEKQAGILKRAAIDRATFERESVEKQAEILMGANTRDMQDMLNKVYKNEAPELLGKINIQDWKSVIGIMGRTERAAAFNRVEKNLQMKTLGRSDDIQAALVQRAPDIVAEKLMARTFLNNPTAK